MMHQLGIAKLACDNSYLPPKQHLEMAPNSKVLYGINDHSRL